MADKYTWYLKSDPQRPFNKDWVLVADKRLDAPVCAIYHSDTGHKYFEYDRAGRDWDDIYGSYFDDDCFQAWMPLPMFYG